MIKTVCVLDLDETLVHTMDDDEKIPKDILKSSNRIYIFEDGESGDIGGSCGIKGRFWGIARPNYHRFLSAVRSKFDILIIWSAGTKCYVHVVVSFLFRNIVKKPDYILTREDCERNETSFHKPIHKLPDILKRKDINSYRSFIVDDREDFVSGISNAITIKKFHPTKDTNYGENDDELLKVLISISVIDKVCSISCDSSHQKDIQQAVKLYNKNKSIK